VDVNISRFPLFVRPQFVYRSSGAAISAERSPGVVDQASYKMNYYSLILPFRYEFLQGFARPYATAGPMLSSNQIRENEYITFIDRPTGIDEVREELIVEARSLGVGFHAGIGFRIPELFRFAEIFTEIRYTNHCIDSYSDGQVFNLTLSGFDFSLGVGF